MNHLYNFLTRIKMQSDTELKPTKELLSKIQNACVLNIPYENMDILNNKRILMDKESLYKKIVEDGRGGYCFELNAFLEFMLTDMGFKVKSCLARFLRAEKEIPLRRHRILIVSVDGEDYFCDIGIGQIAPRLPLLIRIGEVQEQNGEFYRFEEDDELGFVLCDLHDGEWRRFISFTTEKQYEVDYVMPSFYCELHPDSPFNKAPIIAIKTPEGRKTVNGRDFKIFKGEELIHIEEDISDSRFDEILKSEFGIYI